MKTVNNTCHPSCSSYLCGGVCSFVVFVSFVLTTCVSFVCFVSFVVNRSASVFAVFAVARSGNVN